MKKEDIDIRNLMFDPWDKKTVSKMESYEEFKENFGIEKEKLFAYIILTYDLNTQLRKEVPYFNKRKIIAAELAGFEQDEEGRFSQKYEEVLIGMNEKANIAISKYIRLFSSPKYLSLVYYWSILSAEFENVANSKESKDYKSTIANIEKLEAKINECVDFLYGGDEVKDIQRHLYEAVEKENLRLRPESIASADEDELKSILGKGPYDGYTPDPLKFKSHK